jgi:hypothetical protein
VIHTASWPVGKIDGTLRALMGEMFIDNLIVHVRRGMDGVIRDGRHAGGRAYGYKAVPGKPGELEIVEAEAEIIRGELIEMDTLAGQTEAAIFRLLSNVMSGPLTAVGTTSVGELELELQRRLARAELSQQHGAPQRHNVPAVRTNIEASSDRFFDRTIPQATTMILREAGGPLHVNEIYNILMEGGFSFTGHNPTISIAVSLNRNTRFRKVAPGTFDLVIRDAAKAS